MSPSKHRKCPCCGKKRAARTIYRHLRAYEQRFQLPLSDSDEQMGGDDRDSDDGNGPSSDDGFGVEAGAGVADDGEIEPEPEHNE
ncbi:hypothetical protein FRC06_009247, partial [Ceratobasidium sp. 370]